MNRIALCLLLMLAAGASANPDAFLDVWGKAQLRRVPAVDPVWTGLAEYYALNGTALDQVGGQTGEWLGGVVETNAVPFAASGTAASLNKATNSYVVGAGTNALNGASGATVAAWVFRRTFQARGGIFSTRSSTANVVLLQGASAVDTIEAYVTDGSGGASTRIATSTPFGTNTWQHIAVTWSQVTGEIEVYVGGVLASAGTETTNARSAMAQSAPLVMGFDTFVSARKTDGVVDEYGVWDRTLASNEVYRIATEQLIYRAP